MIEYTGTDPLRYWQSLREAHSNIVFDSLFFLLGTKELCSVCGVSFNDVYDV